MARVSKKQNPSTSLRTRATAARVSRPKKDSAANSRIKNPLSSLNGFKLRPTRRALIIFLLVLGLLALAYYKKGWFVTAVVNGQPITTLELNQRMNQLHKERVLNQMVNEKILQQEANKKGIVVSDEQITAKIAEVENQYGGKETFNQLLTQQGLTYDEFARQTKLQLIVEELYKNDITPTEDEIKKWVDENASLPEATEPAKFREMATTTLRQDKLSTVFNEKFQQLRQSASVQTF